MNAEIEAYVRSMLLKERKSIADSLLELAKSATSDPIQAWLVRIAEAIRERK